MIIYFIGIGFAVGIIIGIVKGAKELIDEKVMKEQETAEHLFWINRHRGYKGIHLSEEQIYELEQNDVLPVLQDNEVPIIMASNEVAIFYAEGEILIKNIYYYGQLVITNARLVFVGDEKGFDIPFRRITSIADDDGKIIIQSGSSIYRICVSSSDLIIKIINSLLSDKYCIVNDKSIEAGTQNVEKHENMMSHEF